MAEILLQFTYIDRWYHPGFIKSEGNDPSVAPKKWKNPAKGLCQRIADQPITYSSTVAHGDFVHFGPLNQPSRYFAVREDVQPYLPHLNFTEIQRSSCRRFFPIACRRRWKPSLMGHFGPNVSTNIFVQPRYHHGGCGFSREMIRTYSRVCYTKMRLHPRSPLKFFRVFQNIGVFHRLCCDVWGGPYTKTYQSLIFQSSWYLGL